METEFEIEVLKAYFLQVTTAFDSHPLLEQHTRGEPDFDMDEAYGTNWSLHIPPAYEWNLGIYCDFCSHPEDFGIHWISTCHLTPIQDCSACWEKNFERHLYADAGGMIVLEDPNLEKQVDQIVRTIIPSLQDLRADLIQGLSTLQPFEENHATTQQT